jgi:flagellar M-ring protein FliF
MIATTPDIKDNGINKLHSLFERVRANPKVALIVTASAAISIIIALILWLQTPDWRVLYSNISDQKGGEVVDQLTKLNVPYRFDERAGSIMVPEDKIHEVRLKLAQLGVPKADGAGFELLDQAKLGISQFNEQITYQRALEGELARTIETLGTIQSARVHLALPKPSVFVREQKKPSASITVVLVAGRKLEPEQVVAITNLVSSAVTALDAENVTIVDQNGRLLSEKGAQALQTSQLKYTSEVEQDLQERIQSILAPVVGGQNIRAQVTARIDFTTHEQTAEQYQPNTDPTKMSIRSKQSNYAEQGGRNRVGGVPGALSNQPPTPASAPLTQPTQSAEAKTNTDKETIVVPFSTNNDETTNYELDRTLIHTKQSPGKIEHLSVAVVVNYARQTNGEQIPLSKEKMAQIESLVKKAVGFSESRGDSLDTVNTMFSLEEDEPDIPFWKQRAFIDLLYIMGRYLFIALIVWILWRKVVHQAWTRYQEATTLRLEMERQARKEEKEAQAHKKEVALREKAQQRADTDVNTQQLRDIAEHEPQVIAFVLRRWINKELTGK